MIYSLLYTYGRKNRICWGEYKRAETLFLERCNEQCPGASVSSWTKSSERSSNMKDWLLTWIIYVPATHLSFTDLRSVKEMLDLCAKLEQRRIKLVSLQDNLNTSTAVGRFTMQILTRWPSITAILFVKGIKPIPMQLRSEVSSSEDKKGQRWKNRRKMLSSNSIRLAQPYSNNRNNRYQGKTDNL